MDSLAFSLFDKRLSKVLSEFARVNVVVSSGEFNIFDSPFAEERELVLNAISLRRAEFFTGRYHARQVLTKLGCPTAPILRGEKGNPLWPAGILGTITHDLGAAVVAAMATGKFCGFGIDMVLNPARIDESLQPLIARPMELKILANHCECSFILALAFSLKESVVKAISPMINGYLDLMNIELSFVNGEIRAYIDTLEATFRCGFIIIENGLLSFALLKWQIRPIPVHVNIY